MCDSLVKSDFPERVSAAEVVCVPQICKNCRFATTAQEKGELTV
jgi:hypothetical protein